MADFAIYLDSLTNLADGATFKSVLDARIKADRKMMIGMVSLDDFKRVNREYGYQNGDKFIQSVADYLKEICPEKTVFRYSGDKFTVILEDTSEEEMQTWCKRVTEQFDKPWQVGKIVHKITACISVVEYPKSATDRSEIIELLEYLNSFAKSGKKNQYIICDDSFRQKMERKVHIISVLKDVIKNGKMYVKYQPILDVKGNCYNRAEALFRLTDDDIGEISPIEFFPIAEEHGYVIEIGYVLIEKVCQYIKSFLDAGEEAPIVSVNFSRQQLMAEDVDKRVMDILNKYQIEPKYLAIELPEEVFSVQYDEVKVQMMSLYEKGIQFYLDGFGTGFIDLMHLIELPFEIIKISKNLIRAAEHNQTMYLLVSAMTAVFEENGSKILGDGIESEQHKALSDLLFMDYLQGYYFSEPVSEEKMRDFFEQKDVIEDSVSIDSMLTEMGMDVGLDMEGMDLEAISDAINLE